MAREHRRRVMKLRDKRVKFLTELLQGSKTIKLFAWELKVRDEVRGAFLRCGIMMTINLKI
jgi:hypothetical protein